VLKRHTFLLLIELSTDGTRNAIAGVNNQRDAILYPVCDVRALVARAGQQ
jgi:hypothetical protein